MFSKLFRSSIERNLCFGCASDSWNEFEIILISSIKSVKCELQLKFVQKYKTAIASCNYCIISTKFLSNRSNIMYKKFTNHDSLVLCMIKRHHLQITVKDT